MDPDDPMDPPMSPPTITESRPTLADVISLDLVSNRSQCTARNRAGVQCGNRAIPGGRVCRMHGGAAPQVQQAAVERIRAARDLALSKLHESLESHGDDYDPRTLLDIVTKLTAQHELLEGRATARNESTIDVRAVQARIDAKLTDMLERRERRESIL